MSVKKPVNQITDFVKTLVKSAPAIALTAAAVPDIMDFLGGLTEPFDQVGEAMEELGLVASDGFEQMATDIADSIYALEPVAQGLGDWIGDTYDKFIDKDWVGVSDNISTGLSSAWDEIVGFFSNDQAMTDIGSGVSAMVNGIADFLGDLSDADSLALSEGIMTMIETGIDGVDWGNLATGITNGVDFALKDLPSDLGNMFAQWIYDVISAWFTENEGDPQRIGAERNPYNP